MNNNNIIFDGDVREFNVDYSRFNILTKILSDVIQSHRNAWFSISDEEANQFLHSALHVYAIINLRQLRARAGKVDKAYASCIEFSKTILVPRFYRDIFREICRPMRDSEDIWIPNFEEVSSFDFYKVFKFNITVVNRLNQAYKKLDIPSVPLEEELLSQEQLTVYHPKYKKLASNGPIPQFRWEAVSSLRHIVYQEVEFEASTPSVLSSVLRSFNATKGLSSLSDDGRIVVGSVSKYTQDLHKTVDPVFLHDYTRFPTDLVHSSTPPGTPHKAREDTPRIPKKRRNKVKSVQQDDTVNILE